MTNKHMKRRPIILVIREMQIKITRRYHYTPIRMTKIREFPGGPEVRTWHFHFSGPGSIPVQGTKIPKTVWIVLSKNGK